MRIIKSQYDAGNINREKVLLYVPKRITQSEADEILNAA